MLTLHRQSTVSKRKRNRLDQCRKLFFLQLKVQGKYLCVRSLYRIESTWLVNLSVIMRALFSQTLPSFARYFSECSCLPCVFTSHSLTPLCEHNSEPHLSVLLPGLGVLSVGGRVPQRGRRTDVAYIMICKSVIISAALIPLASLRTSPCGWLILLCQALLCHAKAEKPKAHCYFPPLVRESKSMGSAGTAFTAPLEGNYQHLSARGQSGHRMIAWGPKDNSPIWEHNVKQSGQRQRLRTARRTPIQWQLHNGITCCKSINLSQATASYQCQAQRLMH